MIRSVGQKREQIGVQGRHTHGFHGLRVRVSHSAVIAAAGVAAKSCVGARVVQEHRDASLIAQVQASHRGRELIVEDFGERRQNAFRERIRPEVVREVANRPGAPTLENR